jgi:hypothetical protein
MSTRERFEKLQSYRMSREPWDLESSADGNLLRRDQVLDLADEIDGDVARDLAPREHSPELAEAEKWLRRWLMSDNPFLTSAEAKVITDELDRLRAEIARLQKCSATSTKEPTT